MSYMRQRRAALRYNNMLTKVIKLEDEMDACLARVAQLQECIAMSGTNFWLQKELQTYRNRHYAAKAKHKKYMTTLKKMELRYDFSTSIF